ncbi:unnamed protein product [Didymodactylos carnosus]|uniref:PDZ domain-containing protein n=1 Tax=Didymodactylos carnosus TaxID=1234261 RepID=A0A813RU01_9BILA|nr:unnamed protein product [Didymodactylos carnosus]CAF3569508.1 unnamed protein product [Didymodactylos carnosus]
MNYIDILHPSSSTSEQVHPGLREIKLERDPNYSGYGFHLQYNKITYLAREVEENSPAQRSGLRTNDLIRKINGEVTDKMPHSNFVKIVNDSNEITFTVEQKPESAILPEKNVTATTTTVVTTTTASDAGRGGEHQDAQSDSSKNPKEKLKKKIHKITARS